jgi:hypothetical protein
VPAVTAVPPSLTDLLSSKPLLDITAVAADDESVQSRGLPLKDDTRLPEEDHR